MPSHVTKRHSLQSNSNGTGNGGGNGEEFEDGVGIEPEILGPKKEARGLARFMDGLLVTCFLIAGTIPGRVGDGGSRLFAVLTIHWGPHFISYCSGRSMAPKAGAARVEGWASSPKAIQVPPSGPTNFKRQRSPEPAR